MSDDLLPCPFCGGEARKWEDPSHSVAWFIGCDDGETDCFGSIHWSGTEAEAIAAWNRRAIPATNAREKALRDAAAVCDEICHVDDPKDYQQGCLDCSDAILALIGEAKP